MLFTWLSLKRGLRLIVDGQHVKTVSKDFKDLVTDETIEKLCFDHKRLSEKERQILLMPFVYPRWLLDLQINEKHIAELIKNSKPIAKRIVKARSEVRKEICFDNGTKIKIPDKIYKALALDETTVHLNY
ncbi:hypothetical protein [Flavobacterium fluviatile]|uniref:hypothetical protein n=1 Tax=Flavobacterium fluviatile TaxID=1862387 RepID=UPI0013D4A923|nr:hypothetical protein [Flavobacterium fluviatile]